MRHFIYQDEKSHKFWAVEQQGNELHISWGKVGTKGQSQIKSFSDAAAVAKAELKLIAEKVKKGYVERYKSEQDRRVVKIGLTRKGRIIYDAHAAFHEDLVNALLKGIESKEEQQTVRCALSNLWDFIDKQNN